MNTINPSEQGIRPLPTAVRRISRTRRVERAPSSARQRNARKGQRPEQPPGNDRPGSIDEYA